MTGTLTPWLILWALITTAVVILAFWRLLMGLHDLGGIHISEGAERELKRELHLTRTIDRIERWGKALTVVSAVLILGIGIAWLANAVVAGTG